MTMKGTRDPSLKPSRARGGILLGKPPPSSKTFVCRSILEFGVVGTDVHMTAIPYKDEAQADAATNDLHFKLMFRLLKFEVQEEQESRLQDIY